MHGAIAGCTRSTVSCVTTATASTTRPASAACTDQTFATDGTTGATSTTGATRATISAARARSTTGPGRCPGLTVDAAATSATRATNTTRTASAAVTGYGAAGTTIATLTALAAPRSVGGRSRFSSQLLFRSESHRAAHEQLIAALANTAGAALTALSAVT